MRAHQAGPVALELPQAGLEVQDDHLLRIGSELLFQVCRAQGVAVVVLDAQPDIPQTQQLTEDLVEILTVFSSRLYGSRSRKNLRALKETVAL